LFDERVRIGLAIVRLGRRFDLPPPLSRPNESFNGSLRDELLNGEIFYSLAEAKVLIEAWRRHYNTVRRHSSLEYRPPAPETVTPPYPASGAASLHLRPDMAAMGLIH